MSFVSDMLAKIKLIPRIPAPQAGKKKILFVGLGSALLVLIICLIVIVSGMNRARNIPADSTDTLKLAFQALAIPPEDLFLPDEPDFLPGVIPGQERRDSWTAEDAAPFWYNPLEEGDEPWRDRIESVIDGLLEHVP